MSSRPDPIVVDDVRARVVRPRGARGPHDGRWYWRAEVGTRTVWTGWGTRAEARATLLRALAEDPDLLGSLRGEPRAIETLRDLLECWVYAVAQRPIAEGTLRAYRTAARRLARSSLEAVRVTQLGEDVLAEWSRDEVARGRDVGGVAQDVRILRIAWRWGRREGHVPDRELRTPDLRRALAAKPPPYTPPLADVHATFAALDEGARPWVRLALELCLATGARIGEIASLTWDRVDLEQRTAILEGKTGRRTVALPARLVARLAELPRDREEVLGLTSDSALTSTRRSLTRACQAAGVRHWTPHALRRLAVDALCRSTTLEVGTMAAALGHSPSVMLERYRQVSVDDLRQAEAVLGRLLADDGDNVIAFPGER